MIWIETHQSWARFVMHQSLTTTVVQIVRLSESTLSPMKTCFVRSKRRDQYQSDNRETNDNTKPLSTMINIFHDDKYITLCNFGERNVTQLIVWRVQLTLTLKMTVFRSRLTPSITANTRLLEKYVVLSGYHVPAKVSIKVFIPILLLSFFQISCFWPP